MAHVSVGT